MRTAPVAIIAFRPAVLPVFDPRWKDKCLTCANCQKHQSPQNSIAFRCAAGELERSAGKMVREHCYDMRVGACGPDAVLWMVA